MYSLLVPWQMKEMPRPFNLTHSNKRPLEQTCYVYAQILTTNQRGHIHILLWRLYQSFSGVCELIVRMVS